MELVTCMELVIRQLYQHYNMWAAFTLF